MSPVQVAKSLRKYLDRVDVVDKRIKAHQGGLHPYGQQFAFRILLVFGKQVEIVDERAAEKHSNRSACTIWPPGNRAWPIDKRRVLTFRAHIGVLVNFIRDVIVNNLCRIHIGPRVRDRNTISRLEKKH